LKCLACFGYLAQQGLRHGYHSGHCSIPLPFELRQ
jgi:hypothetical protein